MTWTSSCPDVVVPGALRFGMTGRLSREMNLGWFQWILFTFRSIPNMFKFMWTLSWKKERNVDSPSPWIHGNRGIYLLKSADRWEGYLWFWMFLRWQVMAASIDLLSGIVAGLQGRISEVPLRVAVGCSSMGMVYLQWKPWRSTIQSR